MCKDGENIGLSIGVNICVHIGVNIQKEYFVCIILCEIFIPTLLYYTFSALCLYHALWDFYSNTVVSYIHFSAICLHHALWHFYSNIFVWYIHLFALCLYNPLWNFYYNNIVSYLHFLFSLAKLPVVFTHENVQRQFYWKVARRNSSRKSSHL